MTQARVKWVTTNSRSRVLKTSDVNRVILSG
jgi:hypothetical protein